MVEKTFVNKIVDNSLKGFSNLEKTTLRRLRKTKRRFIKVKEMKPSYYIKISNTFFYNFSKSILKEKSFMSLERDLIKSNLQLTLPSYLSVLFFTMILSSVFSLFLFLFFVFFEVSLTAPFISLAGEGLFDRLVKFAGIVVVIPFITFVFLYFYPKIERKSLERKINSELPFATINMSAISGSMVDPTKIFQIIVSTGEYPALNKEFTKILNEVNVYGYNLVNALKNVAFNCPSKKLSELLGGLSTTITSGGDLRGFFEKRSQNLLFEHNLERQKAMKFAETFMDLYITVVIAAPMILMLLLIIIQISGLSVGLSMSSMTAITILSIIIINIFFLFFLQLKQPNE